MKTITICRCTLKNHNLSNKDFTMWWSKLKNIKIKRIIIMWHINITKLYTHLQLIKKRNKLYLVTRLYHY